MNCLFVSILEWVPSNEMCLYFSPESLLLTRSSLASGNISTSCWVLSFSTNSNGHSTRTSWPTTRTQPCLRSTAPRTYWDSSVTYVILLVPKESSFSASLWQDLKQKSAFLMSWSEPLLSASVQPLLLSYLFNINVAVSLRNYKNGKWMCPLLEDVQALSIRLCDFHFFSANWSHAGVHSPGREESGTAAQLSTRLPEVSISRASQDSRECVRTRKV